MESNTQRQRRFRRRILGLVAFSLLLYAALQPYFVSRAFRQAYRDNDFTVAESFVDFPTLRENLLQREKDRYQEPAIKDQAASMYNLGHAVIERMIVATVRPGGFEALAKMDQSQPVAHPKENKLDLHAWNTYEGLNVFTTELYVQEKGETVPMIKLYFRRRNWSWELYDAVLFGKM